MRQNASYILNNMLSDKAKIFMWITLWITFTTVEVFYPNRNEIIFLQSSIYNICSRLRLQQYGNCKSASITTKEKQLLDIKILRTHTCD